ncbi:glycoside hydrolase family 3 C-terminal domain-containing protein [Amycolatopsis sp. cmx-4-83]|uniref:glycoside hydrolase family 3 C-terminal domain-containing protein n=1 Tax=Amycolatopsis sp. cmx-4-83 TaxID=2790940 RepID=UPI00397996ED
MTGSSTAHDQAVAAARVANLAVVVVGRFEAEGSDLPDLSLPAEQNQLVADVAAVNPNTVVVVNSGSAVTMPWAGSVRGIIESWYPGQEYGNALASILFGDVNPSGKLPVTFPASLADVPAHTAAQWPGQNGTVQYSEGIDVGYRWYDRHNIAPLFPFGYGLSYTTFRYANLTVSSPTANGVTVTFDLTNTGTRAGSEVPQIYVGQPASTGEPAKNLRGFDKVTLDPGQTQRVTTTLDARSFQAWTSGYWTRTAGTYQIQIGGSSRDIRLAGSVTLGGSAPIVGYQNLCADVRAAATANGTPVQIYTCNSSGAQSWTAQGGTLQALGKCLDVTAGGTTDGTPVQLYDCNGSAAQAWQPRGDGSVLNPQSGKCLDDPGSSTTPGTQLVIWACTGGANQHWRLPA